MDKFQLPYFPACHPVYVCHDGHGIMLPVQQPGAGFAGPTAGNELCQLLHGFPPLLCRDLLPVKQPQRHLPPEKFRQLLILKMPEVMDSKKPSIMASNLSHIGLVWQQVVRLQAAGPWLVQETAERLPSVSFRMLPTVYWEGSRFSR